MSERIISLWSSPTQPARRHLGDLASPQACPGCGGSGHQLELIWSGGTPDQEHEVTCWVCQGQGQVIELICGRCGEEEFAGPDEQANDFRICSCCGHEAPMALWLPMSDAHKQRRRSERR